MSLEDLIPEEHKKIVEQHKIKPEIYTLFFNPLEYCKSKNLEYRRVTDTPFAAYCELYMPRAQCQYLCVGKICGYDVEEKK